MARARGVIKGYTAVLEKEKVGKGMTVFVKVTLSVHQMSLLDGFIEAVRGIPEIFILLSYDRTIGFFITCSGNRYSRL